MDDTTPPPTANDIPPPPAPVTTSGSPTDFLKGVVGKRVVVRLTSGVDYRGLSVIAPPITQTPTSNLFTQASYLASMDT